MRLYTRISIALAAIVFAGASLYAQEGSSSKDTTNYNLQEIVVSATQPVEEHLVGPYKQPEWSTHRRFPSTRVYIQVEPGEVEFEQWVEIRAAENNDHPGQDGSKLARFSQELEFGLGSRMQLDIYMNTLRNWNPNDGSLNSYGVRGWSTELRYAFADWGALPGNPTLYLEYSVFDANSGDEGQGYDKIEPKLLLGGEMAERWHWGLNIVTERGLAPASYRDEEYTATGGVSYTAADEKFSLGPEVSFTYEVDRPKAEVDLYGAAGDLTTHELLIGPSFQFRPVKKAHLDVEPLFGLTPTSHALRMIAVFGWDL